MSITELSAERRRRQQRPRPQPNRDFPYDYDVVTRRINRPSSSLAKSIRSVPDAMGALRFEQPFLSVGDHLHPRWEATGRLYGARGGLSRFTRVEIELSAWSANASELRLRPATRRATSWSKRRQRRYFRAAHHGVDDVVRWFDAAVRRRDATVALERQAIVDLRTSDGTWPWSLLVDLR